MRSWVGGSMCVEYVARQVGVLAAEWLQYEWQGRSIEYHRIFRVAG